MRISAAILLAVLVHAPEARTQSGPEKGGRELQLWTGGGHSVSGGTSDSGAWNLGVRYGWVLTGPHGAGFLRGRFEYAVDLVPIFRGFQTARNSPWIRPQSHGAQMEL